MRVDSGSAPPNTSACRRRSPSLAALTCISAPLRDWRGKSVFGVPSDVTREHRVPKCPSFEARLLINLGPKEYIQLRLLI
ncbi:hypothetical protein NDU88_001048 [Pleurodeles waltl]|uniref:Uncharacterized protein n=1 Tax=Pleurodeles waltl TaxID=8319 RepID=A0AAV7SZ69_PLEWA|nr:hypothetical protein NDU88_001048 [Pleurodeles waltl]